MSEGSSIDAVGPDARLAAGEHRGGDGGLNGQAVPQGAQALLLGAETLGVACAHERGDAARPPGRTAHDPPGSACLAQERSGELRCFGQRLLPDLRGESPGIPVLGTLTADLGVQEADRLGIAVYDHVPALRETAENMAKMLVGEINQP